MIGRYVIANRRAGKFGVAQQESSRAEVASVLGAFPNQIVSDNDPSDPLARRVTIVEADPVEMAGRMANLPSDVIIEPEILHWPDRLPPRDFLPIRRGLVAPSAALGVPPTNTANVSVTGGGGPLPNVALTIYARGLGGVRELKGLTDARGTCQLQIPTGYQPAAIAAIPPGGYWPVVKRGAAILEPIDCPPLPSRGPIGWWHSTLGLDQFEGAVGANIKVGVADTGVGPHVNLNHATLVGAYINGNVLLPADARDVDAHGTHVSGTIGARPINVGEYGGVAPGCDLFVARIFPGPDTGASNADIANAIDALSRERHVDLINLSLGATIPSKIVHDAIIDAAERGTLCICAAGNDAGAVNYPAAFPEAVAVSAVGLAGWGPQDSLSATRLPLDGGLFGRDNLYVANFTSFGPQVTCAAPGVGIIAPVPNHFGAQTLYGAMDGTSMASPIVCGALAVLLSRSPAYKALPRDISRTQAARSLLQGALRDIGLPPVYEGRGALFISEANA